MTQYWGGGGGTKHFFLLILYNFKNIGGGARAPRPPLLRGPCYVCVCSDHGQVQPCSFLSRSLLLVDCYELPSLILSSSPALGLFIYTVFDSLRSGDENL